MKNRTSFNFWLDLVSLLVMIALAMTGGLIHFVLPPGTGHSHTLLGLGRHDFGEVHFYLGAAAVALLGLHVFLHWSWVCCVLAKLLGRSVPSRRAQMTGGLSLLLGVVLLITVALSWSARVVEDTAASRVGSAHGNEMRRHGGNGSVAAKRSVDHANAAAVSDTPRGRARRQDVGGRPAKRLEDCSAGAAINGRTSLLEAARICGVTAEQMTEYLALPRHVDRGERLGPLKRRFGFEIHDVRRLACR